MNWIAPFCMCSNVAANQENSKFQQNPSSSVEVSIVVCSNDKYLEPRIKSIVEVVASNWCGDHRVLRMAKSEPSRDPNSLKCTWRFRGPRKKKAQPGGEAASLPACAIGAFIGLNGQKRI